MDVRRSTALILVGLMLVVVSTPFLANPLFLQTMTTAPMPPYPTSKLDPALVAEISKPPHNVAVAIKFDGESVIGQLRTNCLFVPDYQSRITSIAYGKMRSDMIEVAAQLPNVIMIWLQSTGIGLLDTWSSEFYSGYLSIPIAPDYVAVTSLDSARYIHADTVWARGYTGAGIRIAMLDSGIDVDPAVRQKYFGNRLIVDVPIDLIHDYPDDQIGHGTATSFIAAGNNVTVTISDRSDPKYGTSFAVAGIAPGALVINAKININSMDINVIEQYIAKVFEWSVIDQQADIVSSSLGLNGVSMAGETPCNAWCEVVQAAIVKYGIIYVNAAGNNPGVFGRIVYPVRYLPNALAVGTVSIKYKGGGWIANSDKSGIDCLGFFPVCWSTTPHPFRDGSNEQRRSLDVVAPGGMWLGGSPPYGGSCCSMVYEGFLSAGKGNQLIKAVGTSFSAPQVTGVVALVMEWMGTHRDPSKVTQIINHIRSSTTDILDIGFDEVSGNGVIDASKAVPAAPPILVGTSSLGMGLFGLGLMLMVTGVFFRRQDE